MSEDFGGRIEGLPEVGANADYDYKEWMEIAPWSVFKSDLVMTIEVILTEPVCVDARVHFELPKRAGFGKYENVATGMGNTIAEAVENAMSEAKLKLAEIVKERT